MEIKNKLLNTLILDLNFDEDFPDLDLKLILLPFYKNLIGHGYNYLLSPDDLKYLEFYYNVSNNISDIRLQEYGKVCLKQLITDKVEMKFSQYQEIGNNLIVKLFMTDSYLSILY